MEVPDSKERELFELQLDSHEVRRAYSNPDYASIIQGLKVELQGLREQYEVVDIPQKAKKNIKN
jgi:hypothetical protein